MMSTPRFGRSRRRALPVGLGSLVIATLVAACATQDETSQSHSLDEMEPVVIKLAEFNPEQGVFGQAWIAFEEEVTEATDGKITFENYWSGALVGGPDSLAGIGDGVGDMGLIIPSYFPTELPTTSWLSGLGNTASSSFPHAVAAGGAATYKLAVGNEVVTQEFAEHNLKVLTATASTPYNMLCTQPVEDAAAAKGKRVRTSGDTWTATAEALGMTPVNVSVEESYESLQRGVIDCHVMAVTGWIDFGLTDVATEYVPVTFAQMIPSAFVMNLDTWESLPVEAQQIIHDAAANMAKFIWDNYVDRTGTEMADLVAKGQVRVNDVTDLDQIVDAQRAAAVEGMVESAPAEVENPQAVIDEFLADLGNWTNVLVDAGYEIPARDPEAILKALQVMADVDLDGFYQKFTSEVVDELRPQ